MGKAKKTRLKIQMAFVLLWPWGVALAQSPAIVTPHPVATRAPQNTPEPTKAEILDRLKSLQKRHHQEIVKLEELIKNHLRDSVAVQIKDDKSLDGKNAEKIASGIAELENKRAELIARRAFIDRLILALDSRWNGRNLQQFLERQLLDMATADLTNPDGASSIWKFIFYASIVVREVPERNENPLNILENYMDFTTVLNPKPPAEFAASRHYTNKTQSYTAKATDRAQIGEHVESRLKQLKPAPTLQSKAAEMTSSEPADIEIRLRTNNPIPFEADEAEHQPEPTISF